MAVHVIFVKIFQCLIDHTRTKKDKFEESSKSKSSLSRARVKLTCQHWLQDGNNKRDKLHFPQFSFPIE